MWSLRTSPTSPYGRKVLIAADVCGLAERIRSVVADTRDPADPLRHDNPLGKIPVLLTGDGTALYDSRVIAEFLDAEAGGGRILPAGAGRFPALVLQALADGICDAALLQVDELRRRPEPLRHQPALDHQAGKVERALRTLEAAPPALTQAPPHVGQIALACALGYLDLRFAGDWRAGHPALVAWLQDFAARVPAFAATQPA